MPGYILPRQQSCFVTQPRKFESTLKRCFSQQWFLIKRYEPRGSQFQKLKLLISDSSRLLCILHMYFHLNESRVKYITSHCVNGKSKYSSHRAGIINCFYVKYLRYFKWYLHCGVTWQRGKTCVKLEDEEKRLI